MIFSLSLPAVLVVSLGAVELNQVVSDKKQTQDIADAAAVAGAEQLGVTPVGAPQRAQSFALTQLGPVQSHAKVSVWANNNGDGTLTVGIDTQRTSFFGNLLPPGGFHTHVQATARAANTVPLCVLVFGLGSSQINVGSNSQLQAPACLVHSEESVVVNGSGSITADVTEAVTTATGNIGPDAALTSAAPLPAPKDPFASVNINFPSACPTKKPAAVTVNLGQTTTLDSYETNPANAIHGDINVNGGTLILSAGEHYFCGNLNVHGVTSVPGAPSLITNLQGADVVLDFDTGATLNFDTTASVSLSGRQSGAMAGFVIVTDRAYSNDFHIQSGAIKLLTGTVYAPAAKLMVDSTPALNLLGANTPWTVIAASNFALNGGGTLTVNANYAASSVPVPTGVGNRRASSVSLAQ